MNVSLVTKSVACAESFPNEELYLSLQLGQLIASKAIFEGICQNTSENINAIAFKTLIEGMCKNILGSSLQVIHEGMCQNKI